MLDKLYAIPIVTDAIKLLENKLPTELYYHSVEHTQRVLKKAVEFAIHENIESRDIEIIAIAAAYHDTGFTVRYEQNEAIGASIAAAAMRKNASYTEHEIETVEKMILSTAVLSTDHGFNRISQTDLADYLLDADLSIFGDHDFFRQCELLRKERSQDSASFYEETSRILENHVWFTSAASDLLDSTKAENVSKLINLKASTP